MYSARYLGEETPFDEKSADLLKRLKDVPQEERGARFVCAIAAVFPGGEEAVARGTIEGRIGHELRGDNGFGYLAVKTCRGGEAEGWIVTRN